MAGPSRSFSQSRGLPWLALAGALLTLGLYIAHQLYNDFKRTEVWERERLQTQARVVSDNLSKQLEASYAALEGIRSDLKHWLPADDLSASIRRFRTLANAMPGVRTFLITDSNGTVIVSNREELIRANFSEREYFRRAKAYGDPGIVVIPPPFMTSLGSYAMNLVLSIFNEDGTFSGIVSATIDPEYFKTLLSSILYADDMWTALAHSEGKLFLMLPDHSGQAGRNLARPGSSFTVHQESGREETWFQGTSFATGEQRMVAVRTIRPAQVPMDKALVIAISREQRAVFAAWQSDGLRQGALYLLLVVVSGLGLSLLQRRQRSFEEARLDAELALKDSAERLTLATSAAGLGTWEFEPKNGTMSWDQGMFVLFGMATTCFQPTFRIWRDRVVPEDMAPLETSLRKAFEAGHPLDTTFRICRTDGDIRTLRIMAKVRHPGDGHRHSMVGTCEDITDRQRNQQALVDRERFVKTVTDALPGMVAYWSRDLRCGFANIAYLSWFGRTPEQMIGIRMQDLMGEALFQKNEPHIRAALRGERQTFERTLIRADGSTGYTWAQYIPDLKNGEAQGFFVLVTDVSELKKTQIALEAANKALEDRTQQAENASRAKTEFLANMSHEIRTPMNAILGTAHLLDHTQLSQDQRELVRTLWNSGRSLLALIDDILDFSRVESGRMQLENTPFRLSDVIDSVAALMGATAGNKALELLIGADTDVPDGFVGDPLRLKQVLVNLVGNAIKFTEKGEVCVRIQRTDPTPGATGTGEAEAENAGELVGLTFSVQDTGIGIPSDTLPLLFEKFTQADTSTTRRFGGSGLGLSISRHLVTLMGGTIQVESTVGTGSTFSFTLSLPQARLPPRPKTITTGMEALTLLIADDHDLARQVLENIAHSLGWEADCVPSGKDAVALAQESGKERPPYDVVLMDWQMPGMDGLEASRQIRALPTGDDAPIVIMVTAHSREDLLLRAESSLVDAVLTKPISGSTLYNAVADARVRRGDAIIGCESGGSESGGSESGTAPPRSGLEGIRMLLVEDNTVNQLIEERILRMEGAEVTLASDGREALEILRDSPDAFDIVFMDMQMPVMDGYEATRCIRADPLLRELPVVALTAGVLTSERDQARAVGLDDFVAKPFDVDQIVRVVERHALKRRRGVRLYPRPPVTEITLPRVPPPKDAATFPPLALDLPGLNMRQATLRVGGNEALLRSLLTQMLEQYRGIAGDVHTGLAEGDPQGAVRLLHGLRGAAGNLSAIRVAELAASLEAAIKDRRDERVPDLLAGLESAMAHLASGLKALPPLSSAPPPPPEEGPGAGRGTRIGAARVEHLRDIESLLDALESDNLSAVNQFEALRPALTQDISPVAMGPLTQAVESLSFSVAARLLRDALMGLPP